MGFGAERATIISKGRGERLQMLPDQQWRGRESLYYVYLSNLLTGVFGSLGVSLRLEGGCRSCIDFIACSSSKPPQPGTVPNH